jgi:SAM-dependent methyltransferase
VHQFGCNVATALRASPRYAFVYEECGSAGDYRAAMARHAPAAVIYNHYPSTMPWLRRRVLRPFKVPHLGIMHEVTQDRADAATAALFDFHIAPDPTLLLRNPLVGKTGRLVLHYENRLPAPSVPTIGSFGFGLAGKGFAALIARVQEEFDTAVVRLHIPFAAFGDAAGEGARAIAAECARAVSKPGIRLAITHEFLPQEAMLDFLAGNSLNAFFYDEHKGRGIASVVDHALAVQRPLALTRSSMFRHVTSAVTGVCVEEQRLADIMARGLSPLMRLRAEWCAENLVWDYERIVSAALAAPRRTWHTGWRAQVRRLVGPRASRAGGDWTPNTLRAAGTDSARTAEPYVPLATPEIRSNRVLDGQARSLYQPALAYMQRHLPDMMRRKIPAANVQQAFVLDTVSRLVQGLADPAVLCIGSYDDTAAAALRLSGLALDEIDPVLNYDLATYLSKPTCRRHGYDIVFATSVLEHVREDERFLADIASLLRPGGVAVLTCDYDDGWRPGAPHPPEDFRLYTQRDFRERLLPRTPDLELVDEPRWDCTEPDFEYRGVRYAFATLVLRRTAGTQVGDVGRTDTYAASAKPQAVALG